jgi:hypothetical protein
MQSSNPEPVIGHGTPDMWQYQSIHEYEFLRHFLDQHYFMLANYEG